MASDDAFRDSHVVDARQRCSSIAAPDARAIGVPPYAGTAAARGADAPSPKAGDAVELAVLRARNALLERHAAQSHDLLAQGLAADTARSVLMQSVVSMAASMQTMAGAAAELAHSERARADVAQAALDAARAAEAARQLLQANSARLGQAGEAEALTLLTDALALFGLVGDVKAKSKKARSGDFWVPLRGSTYMLVDVKRYTTAVESAQVTKLLRDMADRAGDGIVAGMLLSLTARVQSFDDMQLTMSDGGQPAVVVVLADVPALQRAAHVAAAMSRLCDALPATPQLAQAANHRVAARKRAHSPAPTACPPRPRAQ